MQYTASDCSVNSGNGDGIRSPNADRKGICFKTESKSYIWDKIWRGSEHNPSNCKGISNYTMHATLKKNMKSQPINGTEMRIPIIQLRFLMQSSRYTNAILQ